MHRRGSHTTSRRIPTPITAALMPNHFGQRFVNVEIRGGQSLAVFLFLFHLMYQMTRWTEQLGDGVGGGSGGGWGRWQDRVGEKVVGSFVLLLRLLVLLLLPLLLLLLVWVRSGAHTWTEA